ncbi:MAG: DNA mismatch repair endonuclease MutL [Candidatus Methanoperedens sp.]|nr:DNA mismatch repair endonuclease MutL [Candidatus Methanoperedens sp.]MCE8428074.1 DNA mismatch repair endonuclease MutL [Candidatus Methanoperedens sp.]
MGKIHVLDESTINKIAAGEVIERPASVVKELIENSIDAGATDIRIEIEKSGKKLIRVTDNGCGMSREDAALSYIKHATSKIGSIEDIEKVTSMGFRGEALSSISSVAKVEIITKTRNELSGTKVIIEGENLRNISDIGTADGTSITVKELFYNTPARKKYLRSDPAEMAHITDVVIKNALGHNDVSFSLTHNGIDIISSPSSGLLDTVVHIYGQEIAREMVTINFKSRFAEIYGYISKPLLTRGRIDFQSIFINNRSVSSKSIGFAIRRGYDTLIPRGRFPVAVLKITVDPEEVDVNVHPAKREVRLSHEWEIADAVTNAVKKALLKENLVPDVKTPLQSTLYGTEPLTQTHVKENVSAFKAPGKDTERRLKRTERFEVDEKININALPDIKVLGQVDSLYVIAAAKDGFTIIDQHAAHERILFEQVRGSTRKDSQELLVPVNLDLDKKENILMKECIPFLEEFGFRISEFGPSSFAITAVPSVLGKLESPGLIHDIIADILSGGKIQDETGIFDRVTRSIACKGAIKAGASCSHDQMESLLKQLFRTENPYTCPHGRPTMVSLDRKELDKLFKRT